MIMKNYKILMIAPTPFFADRGCHVQIYEEARSLQKLGNRVTICTYHNGRDVQGLDIRRIINIPWYKKLEAGPSFHMIYLDLFLFFKSLMVALKMKPDIIHGHLHEGAFIGFFVAKLVRKPLLFDCQGSLTGEMKAHKFLNSNRLFYKLMHLVEKITDNMADVVVTQSTEMVKELQNEFHLPQQRVFLTLDGVDTDEFRPDIDVGELRVKLALPLGKKIVVYLGLLNEYQGVDCLLESIPLVLKEMKDVHFLIMGYPDVEKYKKKAEELGILDSITFTGRIDYAQATKYILLGDVAASPKLSPTEANGKIYNYMACGLPTVAFDTPVNREILGELGVYAPKLGDPGSLAEAMKKILTDDGLAQQLSLKVRERVVNNFSWDNVARRLTACYQIISSDSEHGGSKR